MQSNLQAMIWLLAILKGIGYGLFLGLVSFGPTFFQLIQVGIQGGKSAGLRMAIGIFLSDLTIALACFFGLARIFTAPWFQLGFSAFATLGILFLGVKGFIQRYKNFLTSMNKPIKPNTNLLHGFIVNLLNPFVLLLWVGILGALSVGQNPNEVPYAILVEMLSILMTVFFLDLGKVYLSDWIGKKLNYRIYYFINRYVGLILIAIGIYYAYHFATLLIDAIGDTGFFQGKGPQP